jgi:uncharacterized protein YutE (UPF0331/DUF86 family)
VTDPLVVLRKLTLLREHVARARRRRPDTFATLESDVDLQDALALSLFVSIQEALDIAFHIVADEGWGVPASYAESFEILAKKAVLDLDLSRQLAATAALRNRIAHGYASVELERLWRELPIGLAALDRYAAQIAEYVERRDPAKS